MLFWPGRSRIYVCVYICLEVEALRFWLLLCIILAWGDRLHVNIFVSRRGRSGSGCSCVLFRPDGSMYIYSSRGGNARVRVVFEFYSGLAGACICIRLEAETLGFWLFFCFIPAWGIVYMYMYSSRGGNATVLVIFVFNSGLQGRSRGQMGTIVVQRRRQTRGGVAQYVSFFVPWGIIVPWIDLDEYNARFFLLLPGACFFDKKNLGISVLFFACGTEYHSLCGLGGGG